MDQDAIFRDVETPTRLEDLPLNHFRHRERELRVRHDLKVIADCRDPYKGRQEGKVLRGDPLDGVADGAEERMSADCEVEDTGRISSFDPRPARAH